MPPFVWLYSPMKVPLAFAYSCLLILEELLYDKDRSDGKKHVSHDAA